MSSVIFKIPIANLPDDLKAMSTQDMSAHPSLLPTLKRQSSLDLSAVRPKHLKIVPCSDTGSDDQQYLHVSVAGPPIFGPTKGKIERLQNVISHSVSFYEISSNTPLGTQRD